MKLKRLLIAMAATAATVTSINAQVARPKLVVGIIVDQMRWDFMYTHQDQFGEGGFKRLLGEGMSFSNCIIDYVPTVTACGHASVYTGTTPAVHGIAGNNFFIGNENTSSVRDRSVEGVGTTTNVGKHSPRNLQATTIGDELKLGTDFKAKVVSVALKDRAAILPGGHAADAAYWFDREVPAYITSTYYMDKLPQWVENYNNNHKKELSQEQWSSYRGVRSTMEMAREAIDNEKLGADGVPDLLAISISSTDATQHSYSTRDPRTDSCYRELDRQLELLFKHLDAKVGKGQYTVFLTADHGGTHNYKYMNAHRIHSGAWNPWSDIHKLNDHLKGVFGEEKLIKADAEYYFYLDNDKIAEKKLDREAVKAEAVRWLEALPDVQWAVDVEHLDRATLPAEIKERVAKGYHRKRSGEIYIFPITGYFAGNRDARGSNHGSWNQSDSHIPCVFMGWGVKHGECSRKVGMIDIAPTICSLLHIQSPDGALGNPLF